VKDNDSSQPLSTWSQDERNAHTIDPSFVERLSHLRFNVEGVVDGLHTGLHKSRRRGGGLVFAEHRDYRPGDDPRSIDWRAFARSDHHRVKHFEHEAQLRAVLALDTSSSMAYGGPSFVQTKLGYGATLLGASAEILLRQGDAAGVALFHENVVRRVPIRGGTGHARVLLEALATPATPGQSTRIAASLDAIAERSGRHGAIVIASDLLDFQPGALHGIARLTARGHRVYVLHVLHADELTFPFEEPARFLGPEGEAMCEADPRLVRQSYLREVAAFRAEIKAACAAAGARYVLAATDRPLHEVLREALWPEEGSQWA
jgi:uncharacterized protein (DUF58 family)